MQLVGLLRYRLDPYAASRHAAREKRLRWSAEPRDAEHGDDALCVVCLDAPVQVLLGDCGCVVATRGSLTPRRHAVLCAECARNIFMHSASCPVCRRAVGSGSVVPLFQR
jgi:hypothetical protein